MSFLERIHTVNRYDPDNFRPFYVTGIQLGLIKHSFAEILTRWERIFQVKDTGVALAPELSDVDSRSRAVAQALNALRHEGVIQGWRNESYGVNRAFGEAPYLLIERAAIPFFGIRAYGVHLNGFVRTEAGLKMWVAQRARSKPTEPGKLDQLVAGGQPAGMSLRANLIKECWEEASLPRELVARALPVGAVSYCWETAAGLRPDVIFVFDLELPADFTPVNTDGEVEAFFLWPIEQVISTVYTSTAFKANCALVVIHFLIRHGFIDPEHPDYLALLHGLLAGEKALAQQNG